MSRDWEQDILEWVGDKQVKKLQSGNLIKFTRVSNNNFRFCQS